MTFDKDEGCGGGGGGPPPVLSPLNMKEHVLQLGNVKIVWLKIIEIC